MFMMQTANHIVAELSGTEVNAVFIFTSFRRTSKVQ